MKHFVAILLVKTQGLLLILRVIGEHARQKVSVIILAAISLTHGPWMVLNNFLIFILEELGSAT